MAILNFTTTVTVEKTVGEIQGLLVKHRCRGIQTQYDDAGEITSLAFRLSTEYGERDYALPVNVSGVLATLEREKEAGRLNGLPWTRVNRQQAARVAWRILKDWLEAQLAIVQAQVAPLDQVLLPYLLVDGERTAYQVYREQQAMLPKPA